MAGQLKREPAMQQGQKGQSRAGNKKSILPDMLYPTESSIWGSHVFDTFGL